MVKVKKSGRLANLIALGTALALLSGMAWVVRGRRVVDSATASSRSASIPVKIFEIKHSDDQQVRSLSGLVISRFASDLAFRVSGKIESRLVDVGDRVDEGDPLFQLELTDYQLQVESAQADLASAVATLKQATGDEERMRSLRAAGAVSADEYDRSLAARDVALARHTAADRSLELARNRLSYTTLTAPADGVVIAVMAERGQVVTEGRSIARLTQSNTLEMTVGIPEKYLADLKHATAKITFWSLPGVTVDGQLRELSPTSDPVTRTYEARYSIVEAPAELQLGMSAMLHLSSAQSSNGVFSIPSSALVGRQERFVKVEGIAGLASFVWKVVDEAGHIEPVPVDVIGYGDESVTVKGELSFGDRIVAAGVHKLDSNLTVQKWEELR